MRRTWLNSRARVWRASMTTARRIMPNQAHPGVRAITSHEDERSWQKGMSERAAESYKRAIQVAPEDAQTLNNLGFSLYQNGKYRAAVDRLKRAAKLAPTDQRIWNNLALAQCRLGKTEDCFKSFARAGGELTGRLNTATLLERMGHQTEAIPYYEAALRLQPKSSVALRR